MGARSLSSWMDFIRGNMKIVNPLLYQEVYNTAISVRQQVPQEIVDEEEEKEDVLNENNE